jgi:hypothetical protein
MAPVAALIVGASILGCGTPARAGTFSAAAVRCDIPYYMTKSAERIAEANWRLDVARGMLKRAEKSDNSRLGARARAILEKWEDVRDRAFAKHAEFVENCA